MASSQPFSFGEGLKYPFWYLRPLFWLKFAHKTAYKIKIDEFHQAFLWNALTLGYFFLPTKRPHGTKEIKSVL
jgi:hypothetical protein